MLAFVGLQQQANPDLDNEEQLEEVAPNPHEEDVIGK
jgi:hypothetical protein